MPEEPPVQPRPGVLQRVREFLRGRSFRVRGRTVLLGLAVLAVAYLAVMVANSRKPGYNNLAGVDKKVRGAHFAKVNELLIKGLADNWLPNDLLWPTVFLDNQPSFQLGVLEVVRYNVRVLRDNLSRMRTTDRLDPLAEAAFTNLSNDPFKWWFPSAESKWNLALVQLQAYQQVLTSDGSRFYARADNLVELLNQYLSLMGGVNTRLLNSLADGTGSPVVEKPRNSVGPAVASGGIVPWSQKDDNFYYAQGVAYGLHESFEAIRVDFGEVLAGKNSTTLVDKIVEMLGRCHFEPWIFCNGDQDSLLANHSLNLSAFLNDARQKMDSLTIALIQG